MIDDSWCKPFIFGKTIIMFSKAPFYFSGWLPTLRWKSLSWGRYEFKIIRLDRPPGTYPIS